MAGWREEYLSGIREAERHNPVNLELVDACSQLADRVAALEAEKAVLQQQQQPPDSRRASVATKEKARPSPAADTQAEQPTNDEAAALIARLRLDLTEALRAKGQFQTRLQIAEDELARLRSKNSTDTKSIRDLTSLCKSQQIKLRDRQEELKAKNKLVADVQDELTVLNIQLNLAEQRRKEKEEENKQLIERFMKRVGQEADAMNLANEPLFKKRGDRDRGR
ncbi:autophagy protein 16 [Rhypophila sp. PSN 637]